MSAIYLQIYQRVIDHDFLGRDSIAANMLTGRILDHKRGLSNTERNQVRIEFKDKSLLTPSVTYSVLPNTMIVKLLDVDICMFEE